MSAIARISIAATLAALGNTRSSSRDWSDHRIVLLPKDHDPDQTDWVKSAAAYGHVQIERDRRSYHIDQYDELQVPPGQYIYSDIAPLVKRAMENMTGKRANTWYYGAVIVRCDCDNRIDTGTVLAIKQVDGKDMVYGKDMVDSKDQVDGNDRVK